ncbi:4,5-dihydroxyphthalate decarboxylase [Actinomycetospora succinea]|uniref:4,5-dihydroxyphthalate decarboxylase n=1 Tax=Actinomycetospora succinea TaxID=663603 RepID=A0A4R6VWC6_9PSEU|nr:4,5-dihydroxyphthalate decarboxylase [Actinomycetospora succinea]TDQ64785.1 4,5-dihydroxyphthalate decarboxylase [Actinomycetospora succinea]
MAPITLSVASARYDHMRALFDGTVTFDGVDATLHSADLVSDIFDRMVREQAFDVAELGLTFYLRTLDLPDPPFVALPVFPARHFRHSAIWVSTASGIEKPQDLAGRTVGEFAVYGTDPGVWLKGILAEEHGVTPDRCRWVVGGVDAPMPPFDFVPFRHPSAVDVSAADGPLGPMLEAGEIDALISAHPPRCVLDGSPRVAPLFPDTARVEQDWYARTGILPIMHTVVARRELLDEHPGLARTLLDGFTASRDAAIAHYEFRRETQQIDVMVPWFGDLYERARALMPAEWWPYGVTGNRATLEAFLRHFHDQGLSDRLRGVEELFVPELLDT